MKKSQAKILSSDHLETTPSLIAIVFSQRKIVREFAILFVNELGKMEIILLHGMKFFNSWMYKMMVH